MAKKLFKVPVLFMLAGLMALVASPAYAVTNLSSSDCGAVLSTANETYVLTENMDCSATRHGLVIAAEGITIDGAGFKIDGGSVSGRNCEALVAQEGEDDVNRQWCQMHPCRQAADGYVMDSGIVNANTSLGTSCNSSAPMGQGGCDNVTIKNLEITNFCDGIWVSGDCDTNGDGVVNDGGATEDWTDERRLTGIVIEGNEIHDCGGGSCGTYTAATSDGGDWENRYYNDGIFTAQIGLDASNSTAVASLTTGGLPIPAAGQTTDMFQWWKATDGTTTVDLADLDADLVKIQHNKIYDISGCGCVSCSGGMGITLQGGIETDNYDPTEWATGVIILKNQIKNCAMSGISHSHAITSTRITGNEVVECQLGGITNGCNWNNGNYIFENYLEDNYGLGIAISTTHIVANNRVVETHVQTDSNLSQVGYPVVGANIGILPDSDGSLIVGNIACAGAGADIMESGQVVSASTGYGNQCDDPNGNFGPGCEYSCGASTPAPFYSLCFADMNYDCSVNTSDLQIYVGEKGSGPSSCCP